MNAALPKLDTRRAQAAEQFRALGVPHRRVEAWKYTDLRAVTDARKVEMAPAARVARGPIGCARIWALSGVTAR
jgi:Fe-S cluster assembly protein SufD